MLVNFSKLIVKVSNYHPCAKKALWFFTLYWLVVAQLSVLTHRRQDWIAGGGQLLLIKLERVLHYRSPEKMPRCSLEVNN